LENFRTIKSKERLAYSYANFRLDNLSLIAMKYIYG